MSDEPKRYVVAVKRRMRSEVPSDWLERLQTIDGLSLAGRPQRYRAMVDASPAAIEVAKTLFGDYVHVEPVIEHRALL